MSEKPFFLLSSFSTQGDGPPSSEGGDTVLLLLLEFKTHLLEALEELYIRRVQWKISHLTFTFMLAIYSLKTEHHVLRAHFLFLPNVIGSRLSLVSYTDS